jgi:LPS export ABC transporter protein LptC
MNKRNGIILALLFIILVIEIIVISPKELGISPADDVEQEGPPAPSGSAGQIMRDVHLVQAKVDGKEWELWASRALKPKDNEKWVIEHVKVKFFADKGVTYTVTGKKGEVIPNGKVSDLQIMGDVETKSSNGYTFKTQSSVYESKKRHLTSPEEVEMAGPPDKDGHQLHLTGANMTADLATNEISINRNVHATKNVSDKDHTERLANIQSQRALFSGKTKLAQFFGNVVIEIDTMQVTGPVAKFAYDSNSENLDSMQVGGGVRLTDTDKFATSGSLNILFKENRVVFEGSPRVVQNGDEIVGDKIVLLDGGKRVQVLNAKAQIDPKTMEKHQ